MTEQHLTISVLPPEVANAIAAGEVVQRPASVLKELLDNAIDAGADRIVAEAEGGGIKRLMVADNGRGMSAADAVLAAKRHSTSKIRTAEDLQHITTLGFRGEALASISAVAHLTILTRQAISELGHQASFDAAGEATVDSAGAPEGTRVEVRDLFYNVPARRKFLRTEATEYNWLTDTVSRSALAFPEVAYSFRHNGRLILELPAVNARRERVLQVLKQVPATDLLYGQEQGLEGSAEAFLGGPSLHHRNAGQLYFIVNRRYVQDRVMLRGVMEAFRLEIPSGRYPIGAVYLDLDPAAVDVNVHPTKEEVRFRNESAIYSTVNRAARRTVIAAEGAGPAPAAPTAATQPVAPAAPPLSTASITSSPSTPEADSSNLGESAPPPSTGMRGEPTTTFDWKSLSFPTPPPSSSPATQLPGTATPLSPASELPGYPTATPIIPASELPGYQTEKPQAVSPRSLLAPGESLEARAQVANIYILAEIPGKGDIIVIDQHAAHERIRFEELKAQRAQGRTLQQELLFPLTWEVRPGEEDTALANLEHFRRLGFSVEHFGDVTFMVNAIPVSLDLAQSMEVLTEMLHEIQETGREARTMDDMEERLLVTVACHSAVRAGQKLDLREMQALVRQLFQCPQPDTCPHGRPTMLRWTQYELEKAFKRVK